MIKKDKYGRFLCPICGKLLKLMIYDFHCDIGIYHCGECLNGIDSDWEIYFTEEGNIERIQRYYFG